MSPRESEGVRRPNNSVGHLKKGLIVNGLAQGARPCTFECKLGDSPIPSESGAGPESGFGSPASPG